MTERSTLFVVLTALYLGSRIPYAIGENAFYALLGVGWAAFLMWTVVAWRRGEKVFTWQHRGG
jgi:hypothetical protein